MQKLCPSIILVPEKALLFKFSILFLIMPLFINGQSICPGLLETMWDPPCVFVLAKIIMHLFLVLLLIEGISFLCVKHHHIQHKTQTQHHTSGWGSDRSDNDDVALIIKVTLLLLDVSLVLVVVVAAETQQS